MGVSRQIKTDNGPAYTSHKTQEFFHNWDIKHVTGIAHSPTGQAIVERAYFTLKNLLQKQKRENPIGIAPQEELDKAIYVLHFFNLSSRYDYTSHKRLLGQTTDRDGVCPEVTYKDVHSDWWKGPVPLLAWKGGYGCVSLPIAPYRLLARYIKPSQGRQK